MSTTSKPRTRANRSSSTSSRFIQGRDIVAGTALVLDTPRGAQDVEIIDTVHANDCVHVKAQTFMGGHFWQLLDPDGMFLIGG